MHSIVSLLSLVALTFAVSTANAHGPDGAKHQLAQLGDMTLESGAVVKNLKYRTSLTASSMLRRITPS